MKLRIGMTILIVLYISLAFVQARTIAGYGTNRYVSKWTEIPGHSAYSFVHNLGSAPLELDVWVSHQAERRAVAIPIYEMNGEIQVTAVSHSVVVVQNNSDNPTWVKVVAVP